MDFLEVAVSPSRECTIGTDTVSDEGTFPLPSFIQQKAHKVTLRSVLVGHNPWEPTELPEPTQVVNLKLHRIPREQKEMTTPPSNTLDTGTPVNTFSVQ